MRPEEVARRLEALESRLAFQDDAVDRLSDVVARQDGEIRRLLEAVRKLESAFRELAGDLAGRADGGDEPPPHY